MENCFETLKMAVCANCGQPVDGEPGKLHLCEECFTGLVNWARKKDLFGSDEHWKGT